jgi:hypothetical protein
MERPLFVGQDAGDRPPNNYREYTCPAQITTVGNYIYTQKESDDHHAVKNIL